MPHDPQPMPFAARRRHQYWSVDIRYIEDHALGTGKPVYVISILENFSRALLASAISPRQDLTAYLIVLRAAVEAHGAPEVLVSDSGGVFKAKQAQAIYAALGIAQGSQIDQGQAWQNYIETHFNVMRRMADYHYARATTWAELQAVHDRFFHDYNQQAHFAHRERTDGRRSPGRGARLGAGRLVRPGRPRPPLPPARHARAQRARLRALPALAALRGTGSRRRAGRGLGVGRDADDRVRDRALAQYRVALEADGRRLREVDEPRFFATGHASPQPFLAPLAETAWLAAQRLIPYRPRRSHRAGQPQLPLFAIEEGADAVG